MTNADRKAFGLILTGMAATFHFAVDEAVLEGYWIALGDLGLPAIRKAATIAARTLKFMPKGAELREMAGDISLGHRCLLAFDQLSRAIGNIGGNKSIDFDDPAMNATVRAMGGWPELCECPHEEYHSFKQAQFEKTYRAFCTVGVSPEQAAPLVGRFERENRLNGHRVVLAVRFVTGLPAAKLLSAGAQAPAIAQDLPRLELKDSNS